MRFASRTSRNFHRSPDSISIIMISNRVPAG